MKFSLLLFFFLSNFLGSIAFANKLIVIQAISKTNKSFVTRLGRKDGVFPGTKGTFTGDNVSIIARASTVTREFTQWTVDNKNASVPFVKDEVITFHNTSEYIWTLMPEEVRRKYVKELQDTYRNSVFFRTSLSTGIKQSTSGVDNLSTSRGGFLAEIIYEKEFTRKLSFGTGLRIESEVINVESSSLKTNRFLALFEGTYYTDELASFYNGRIYLGLSLGYGSTTTTSSGSTASGQTWLLPGVRLGIMLPLDNRYKFHFESALETISSEEGGDANTTQTTDATNLRYGIGIRRYF
jgi:hypothetical protein